MSKRLEGRTALVFGAGSSGPGWGNGKAAAVLYAREGARVVAVDRNGAAAEETRDIIRSEGNAAEASWNKNPKSFHADSKLGMLTHKGACWENAKAQICARRLRAHK